MGGSYPAARNAIAALEARGMLRKLELEAAGRGRPPAWFAADQLVDLVSRWAG